MANDLFNKKTIGRFCSNINISKKQKDAAKEWLKLLDEGKLKKEKLNYIRFVEIILKDLLMYDVRDMPFEEGNIEFSFKGKDGKPFLGIEAKGTKTKDLFSEQKGYREGQSTPVNQLWTYIGKLDLRYGIATNYKDFILLDRNKGSSTYHLFNFESLKDNENKLKEFIAIFSKEQIIDNGFIEKLKEESAIEERNFTKEFYKLFHETRLMLIKEFQEENITKEEAISFAQLYLNRLMFIFFAEDTGKLDRRIFEEQIIEALKSERLISDHSSLVSQSILTLFESLDKGATMPKKIFGFNGGLFKEKIPNKIYFKDLRDKKFFNEIYQYSKIKKELDLDEISKSIFNKYQNKINPIIKNLLIMASFDFNTEVNVNILGHIFEQSLSDLEQLRKGDISKRKKEGIYYTPEYITTHICRNTIIPCLSKNNVNTPRDLVLEHSKNIKELEDKFKNIKILDPACGSGAFLIKAVDVLLEIYKEIQLFKQDQGEYAAIKKGKKIKKQENQFTLTKWNEEAEAKEIIENNIFGVDINEESVEITKLSLFLKIATKNKKLINLSKNIKCGNSLIDDKNIDSKAFDWEKEFPFKFDVVVGNPPYGAKLSKEDQLWLNKKYGIGSTDTAQLMMKLSRDLLKYKGYHGFIIPKAFIFASNWKNIRNLFLPELVSIVDCKKVWKEVKLEQMVYIINKSHNLEQYKINVRDKEDIIEKGSINKKYCDVFGFLLNDIIKEELSIGLKIKSIKTTLNDLGKNQRGDIFQKEIKDKGNIKVLAGANIQKYRTEGIKGYVDKNLKYDKKAKIKDNSVLVQRLVAHIENPKDHIRIIATIENGDYLIVDTINQIQLNNEISNKYILCVLNSRLLSWYAYRFIFAKAIRTMQFDNPTTSRLPIPSLDIQEQKPFIKKTEEILNINKKFYNSRNKFVGRIKDKFKIEKINNKLNEFFKLGFGDFIKEVERLSKTKILLKEQDELEDYFNDYKKNLIKLKNQIVDLDQEIGDMIYKLYEITGKEKKIIEKG